MTFQVVGRVEVSIRQVYRDIILESLATIPEIFGYIGMIDKIGGGCKLHPVSGISSSGLSMPALRIGVVVLSCFYYFIFVAHFSF